MSLLTDAAAIVASSSAWCKGANARDASGKWCSPLNPHAVAWDVYGALVKATVAGSYHDSDFDAAYAHLKSKIPTAFPTAHQHNTDIEFYNDSLVFSNVAGLFS